MWIFYTVKAYSQKCVFLYYVQFPHYLPTCKGSLVHKTFHTYAGLGEGPHLKGCDVDISRCSHDSKPWLLGRTKTTLSYSMIPSHHLPTLLIFNFLRTERKIGNYRKNIYVDETSPHSTTGLWMSPNSKGIKFIEKQIKRRQ